MFRIHNRVSHICGIATTFLAIFVFPNSIFAQQEKSAFELGAGMSAGNSLRSKGITSQLGYEFSASFSPFHRLKLGITLGATNSYAEYDLIGKIEREKIRSSIYQMQALFRLLDVPNFIDIDVTSHLGVIVLSSDEHPISIGALGSITIPGRSEHLFAWSMGTVISKSLFSKTSLFLSPQIVFVSPLRLSSAGYSLAGGLSFGIF